MNITADRALELIEEGAVLLDIRSMMEYKFGHIKGAISMPMERMTMDMEAYDKSTPLIVYCFSGSRTPMSIAILKSLGYENVYDLGGIAHWPYEVER